MRGHKAASASLSFELLLLLAPFLLVIPAALRTLSMRLGSLGFAASFLPSLSFLPRFWSFESMYFDISFANALESFADMVLVIPSMRVMSSTVSDQSRRQKMQ
jgi:hypothetical protein